MSEFREPWKHEKRGPVGIIVGPKYVDFHGDLEFSPEDAARVVAAVNFCRNLPTEWLEHHVATGAMEVTTGDERVRLWAEKIREISE